MWIRKETYNQLIEELEELRELKKESGEALLERLMTLAKKCNIDVHGEEYQTFMSRMFMDVAGRYSGAAKAYSKMAFVKDTPEEVMARAQKLKEQASVITKRNPEIEYKEEPIEIKKIGKKRRRK